MILYSGRPIRLAYERLRRYVEIVRWLFKLAYQSASWQLIASPILSISSLAFQIVPLMLMVRLVSGVQKGASGQIHAKLPFIDMDLSLQSSWVVVLVVTLLVFSAVTKYFARSTAIQVEKKVTIALSNKIILFVGSLKKAYEKWLFYQRFENIEVKRAVMQGARFCGMSLRIILANAINFLYLIAGIGILALLSPPLIFVLLAIMMIGAAISYPLNMRAVVIGRQFEESGRERGIALQQRLRSAIDGQTGRNEQIASEEKAHVIENSFMELIGSRLRILELSHLVYGSFFALIIGVFLWMLTNGQTEELLDYGYILILFFAFRYTFLGMQGIMGLITGINRFMPGILRVHDMLTSVERIKNENSAIFPNDNSQPDWIKDPRIQWEIRSKYTLANRGFFEFGKVYIITSKRKEILSHQLLEIITERHAQFINMIENGLVKNYVYPYPNGMENGMERPLTVEDRKRASWVGRIMRDCDISATDSDCERIIAGLSDSDHLWPAIIRQLAMIYDHVQTGNPLILLDRVVLLHLSEERQRVIYEYLKDKIVIYVHRWAEVFEKSGHVDWFMVGSSDGIKFACPMEYMDEPAWQKARSCYEEEDYCEVDVVADAEILGEDSIIN